jgi:NADH dehydrogenase/NADH:ubiquinone oxidoreductase subunit G
MTASTRLDRDFDGRAMIKRMMPRQNEQVNEIWICDKGRFGHHFTRSDERLVQPIIVTRMVTTVRRHGTTGCKWQAPIEKCQR